MKILPNLPQAWGPHTQRQQQQPPEPVRPVSRSAGQQKEYPHSQEGGSRLIDAMHAHQSRRSDALGSGTENLHINRALRAYQDQRMVAEREYLSTVLGVDEYV